MKKLLIGLALALVLISGATGYAGVLDLNINEISETLKGILKGVIG